MYLYEKPRSLRDALLRAAAFVTLGFSSASMLSFAYTRSLQDAILALVMLFIGVSLMALNGVEHDV